MSLELTYDSDLTSDESSPDTVRPRYTTLPKEWREFVHFKPIRSGRRRAYFYHPELRLLTEEDIYYADTLEQVLDYAEEHLEILAEEGSLEGLPDDLELEIFGVGHPRSTGIAMYSYSERKGFVPNEAGEIEAHSDQMQYWQHVERFPVHRETLPRDAETQFRNALAYGFKALDFPHTNTQIHDVANQYNELKALNAEGKFVVPQLVCLMAGFMKEIPNSDHLPLTADKPSNDNVTPSIHWRKYINTADGDAERGRAPRRPYYASEELRLVSDDDLCNPKTLEAVLKVRDDHIKYAHGKHLRVSADWEIEIFGVGLFDGPRVAMFSYNQCTLYDARTVTETGAVRPFWQIIEKYPMHRTHIPRKMEHQFLRALVNDISLPPAQIQRIADRYWELKVSHANGHPDIVPHLVWLIAKTMTELRPGEMPPDQVSESNSSSTTKTVKRTRLSPSWKEYVNLDNWRYFYNPVLRLITLKDMYDPEIYEDILKIRERYFLCLEEDGMLGKLPQDWEIIIITREKDHGPYVATCSYKECLQFLCHRIATGPDAYWSFLSTFNMHRGYVPEQLETIFLTALEEGTSEALFPFTSQECHTLAQTYWELKARGSIPALVLHVSSAMAKIEASRALCDDFERCDLE